MTKYLSRARRHFYGYCSSLSVHTFSEMTPSRTYLCPLSQISIMNYHRNIMNRKKRTRMHIFMEMYRKWRVKLQYLLKFCCFYNFLQKEGLQKGGASFYQGFMVGGIWHGQHSMMSDSKITFAL